MKGLRLHSILLLTTGLFLVVPHFAFAGFNEFLQDAVFNIVMGILGMFVWLSALLLNFAVNNFIIGFGNTFATTGVGVAVDNTWVIVRDFVNLGFIFGFVYIGFKMILSSSDSNTRRWLVNIILAALLVNFSLFVVKFAIDVSNQLAAQIAVNGLGTTGTVDDASGLPELDIASEFMARMGLSKVFNLEYETVNGAGWGYIFGSALLSLTAMFVFAAGGILIIIRFAVLCLFMVLSPIMFLSWIIPPMKDTFERFWSMFIGRAFFAPVYLLFIYFSLQIISGLQVSVGGATGGFGNPDWAGTFQGAGTLDDKGNAVLTLGTLPFFVLAMIFMGASLVIANKLGADFGDKAVGMGKSFGNRVRRVAISQTAGRGLRELGRMASIDERQLNRGLARMSQGGATSRAAARFLDRTAGAGLRGLQGASVAGSESYNARNTRVGEQNTRLNQMNQQNTRSTAVATQQTAYAQSVQNGNTTARRDANNAMGGQVRRMSNDEVLALIDAHPELLDSPAFVQHLTDGHMTAIRDSGALTNAEHTALGNRRNTATIEETSLAFEDTNASVQDLNNAFAQLNQTIRNMSEERKAGLGVSEVGQPPTASNLNNENVAVHLTDRDLEIIERSGRYTAAQMHQIRDARGRGQMAIAEGTRQLATGNIAVGQEFFTEQRREMVRNSQEAGHMPVDVFASQQMQEFLTPDAVAQRLRNGVDLNDRNRIRDNIDNYIASAPDATERQRRSNIWGGAARGGANASFIAGLGLQNITANPQNNNAAPNNPNIIMPGGPGWNGGNVGPRPGPQP